MIQINIGEYILRSHSPSPDQSPLRTKLTLNHTSVKQSRKKNTSLDTCLDSLSSNLVKPCYTCKFSNLRKNKATKKSITRTGSKEKPSPQARIFFGINSDAPEKISEILFKARAKSPNICRYTLRNKLPMYAAKTLEELLANSKLSQPWRRTSPLRPRYFP